MWRRNMHWRKKRIAVLPPLFSPIRQVLLSLLVVGQNLVLEMLFVIQNVAAPFCDRSVLAHPDFFSHLNIEYMNVFCKT